MQRERADTIRGRSDKLSLLAHREGEDCREDRRPRISGVAKDHPTVIIPVLASVAGVIFNPWTFNRFCKLCYTPAKVTMKQLMCIAIALVAAPLFAQQQPQQHTPLKVGDTAPDFTLPDNNNHPVKLSDFRGKKNVVLAFFPAAFTGG